MNDYPEYDGTPLPIFRGKMAKQNRHEWHQLHGLPPGIEPPKLPPEFVSPPTLPAWTPPTQSSTTSRPKAVPIAEFDPEAPNLTKSGQERVGRAAPDMRLSPSPQVVTERDPETGHILATTGPSQLAGARAAGKALFAPFAGEAVERILRVMRSPNDKLALAASQAVLAYAVGKPTLHVDATSTNVRIDLDQLLVQPGSGGSPTIVGTDEAALADSLDALSVAIAERRAALKVPRASDDVGPVIDIQLDD